MQLISQTSKNFENNESTLGVFTDPSKAFDNVDHQNLIKKLEYYRTNDHKIT